MKWSYGVTTVPSRRDNLLLRTLKSLAAGGFDQPRLFVDGSKDIVGYESQFGLATTIRYPAIKTAAHWVLSAEELYFRDPLADRYAVFQDDLVTYRNLRRYLEVCWFPDRGYCNLYTFPQNQFRVPKNPTTGMDHQGWFLSNQMGLGAVALVFSNEGIRLLLGQQHLRDRAKHPIRGNCCIDGGIVEAFKMNKWREYVHNPTLIQHIGELSSMRNGKHPQAVSFLGEEYDAMGLVPKRTISEVIRL